MRVGSSEPRVALKLDFAKWSARSARFPFPRQVARSFLLSSFNAFPQYIHFSRRFTERASAALPTRILAQAHAVAAAETRSPTFDLQLAFVTINVPYRRSVRAPALI